MPNLTGLLSINGRELILQSQLWVDVMPCGCLDSHTFKHFEIFFQPSPAIVLSCCGDAGILAWQLRVKQVLSAYMRGFVKGVAKDQAEQ